MGTVPIYLPNQAWWIYLISWRSPSFHAWHHSAHRIFLSVSASGTKPNIAAAAALGSSLSRIGSGACVLHCLAFPRSPVAIRPGYCLPAYTTFLCICSTLAYNFSRSLSLSHFLYCIKPFFPAPAFPFGHSTCYLVPRLRNIGSLSMRPT